MSAFKMYRVGMIMDKGGKTYVFVAAMNRADATGRAKREHPNWHCTGEVTEV